MIKMFILTANSDYLYLQNYWGELMKHNKQRMQLILLFDTFENDS